MMTLISGMRMRSIKSHVPERTCVACRETKPKKELIRLVRCSDGSVEIDYEGRKAGRGAYLCKSKNCWESALSKKRKDPLTYNLKANLSSENRKALIEYSESLSVR